MVLYWSENVVVGFFNVLKMIKARGQVPATMQMTLNDKPVTDASRRPLIFFFVVHYGMFTLGHGVFVLTLFGFAFPSLGSFFFAFALLFISHGLSYQRHFISSGEYLRISFAQLFWQPYKRVIVMHLTIVLGGIGAKSLGASPLALVLMIGLKTGIDLFSHVREHRKFSAKDSNRVNPGF